MDRRDLLKYFGIAPLTMELKTEPAKPKPSRNVFEKIWKSNYDDAYDGGVVRIYSGPVRKRGERLTDENKLLCELPFRFDGSAKSGMTSIKTKASLCTATGTASFLRDIDVRGRMISGSRIGLPGSKCCIKLNTTSLITGATVCFHDFEFKINS